MLKKILSRSGLDAKNDIRRLVHKPGKAVPAGEVGDLAAALPVRDDEAARALMDFYGRCDGLLMSWEWHGGQGSELHFGSIDTVEFDLLKQTIKVSEHDLVPFDSPVDGETVILRAEDGKLTPWLDLGADRGLWNLGVGLKEYFELMDCCRGLYPWQKALAARRHEEFSSERDQFRRVLGQVFPDAELERF